MHTQYFKLAWAMLIGLSFTFYSCQKDKEDLRKIWTEAYDPVGDPDGFSRALGISGTLEEGEWQSGQASPDLYISEYLPTALVTEGSNLFLPVGAANPTLVSGIQVKVGHAENYWVIPAGFSSGDIQVLNVQLPPKVVAGNFDLYYRLFNSQGAYGAERILRVKIEDVQTLCQTSSGTMTIDGNEGLTVHSFLLGSMAGTVSFSFDTYSVPDRIDIRYGGEWVASTGDLLPAQDGVQPVGLCSEVGVADGYVGTVGSLPFQYDPGKGRRVDVYVSGCIGSGTAWSYTIGCPGSGGSGGGSGGNIPTNNTWTASLPACPCTYDEARAMDGTSIGQGTWYDCGPVSNSYHYGASYEVRWAPDKIGDAGQQCTYDSEKRLITRGLGAGTPDWVSPQSCGTWQTLTGGFLDDPLAMTSVALSHRNSDVKPWEYGHPQSVDCFEYMSLWAPNTGGGCGVGVSVNDFSHLSGFCRGMTCEEITALFRLVDNVQEPGGGLYDYLHDPQLPSPSSEELAEWLYEIQEEPEACGGGNSVMRVTCIAIQRALSNL